MDSFADTIGAPPPVAKIPAPPRGTFADGVAAFFGAGPDIAGAYEKGLGDRSQYQLRSAQTEGALARAEMDRAERMRKQQEIDLINKIQSSPDYAPSMADTLVLGRNPQQYGLDPLSQQEHTFRELLGNPNADPVAQFAAGQGVQGKVLPRLYDVGGETVNMTTDPNTTFQTPAQRQDVAATRALEIARLREPAAGSGAFTLGGVRYGADGQPVVPINEVASNAAQVAKAVAAARSPPAGALGNKPLTEFQVKALGQLSRMDRTEQILQEEFANYTPPLADVAADAVPLAGNYIVSKQYQGYKQAAREWISGLLRLDSGAAVPESEFKTYFNTFFQQPGDDETVVAQKAAGREAATAALRAGLPQVAAAVDASRGAAPAGGAAAPSASGWTKQVSPSTGAVRWINKATGQTRTEAP